MRTLLFTALALAASCLSPLAIGKPCSSDADCDDGLACVNDRCFDGDGEEGEGDGEEGEGEGEGGCVDGVYVLVEAANRASVAAATDGSRVALAFTDAAATDGGSGTLFVQLLDPATGPVGDAVTVDSVTDSQNAVVSLAWSEAAQKYGVLYAHFDSPSSYFFRFVDAAGGLDGLAHGVDFDSASFNLTGSFVLDSAVLLPRDDGFEVVYGARDDEGGVLRAGAIAHLHIGEDGVAGAPVMMVEDAVLDGVPLVEDDGALVLTYSQGGTVESLLRLGRIAPDGTFAALPTTSTPAGVIGSQAIPTSSGLFVAYSDQSGDNDRVRPADGSAADDVDLGVAFDNYVGRLAVQRFGDGVVVAATDFAGNQVFAAELDPRTGLIDPRQVTAPHTLLSVGVAAVGDATVVVHTRDRGTPVDNLFVGVDVTVVCR